MDGTSPVIPRYGMPFGEKTTTGGFKRGIVISQPLDFLAVSAVECIGAMHTINGPAVR